MLFEELKMDQNFPVRFSKRKTGSSDTGYALHWHEAVEFYYVVSGSINIMLLRTGVIPTARSHFWTTPFTMSYRLIFTIPSFPAFRRKHISASITMRKSVPVFKESLNIISGRRRAIPLK